VNFEIICSAPAILNKEEMDDDDDDDDDDDEFLMPDMSLVETLNRYPSYMPSKEKP
jgi:hypothetical protein